MHHLPIYRLTIGYLHGSLRAAMLAVFALVTGANVTSAQTQSAIAVACSGSDTVPAATLGQLCKDLHRSLIAKYPKANFVLSKTAPADANAIVMLEALTANSAALEARLTWKLPGSNRVEGPRMGLSISDKDLTPEMQFQFLNRLVRDTPLPL